MSMPTTVLGQHVAELPAPEARALVVILIDIDDFEVSRLARGDCWAAEQLAIVEQVLANMRERGPAGTSITFVAPDAWVLAIGGNDADQLGRNAVAEAEAIRDEIVRASDVSVTIGVSRPHGGGAKMELALGEAVAGIERKLLESGNRVSTYVPPNDRSACAVPERIEQELARAIRDGDVEMALTVLSAWIDRIAEAEGATPGVLRRWVSAELMYALDVSGRQRLADGSVDWFDALSRLSLEELVTMSGIHDRSYLMLWLQRLLDRIVDVPARNAAGRHVLVLVEDYISVHSAEDLHLADVAAAVFVSPYYISHLFQREKGTTFLRYLTAVRMQKGRELLATSAMPVQVIAGQVGYLSAKRFTMLFKRTFKVSPSEFRLQHRR
jgi:AraC-like DNA-binding protein